MLARSVVLSLLERFPRLTIALVGDLFLDRYLEIDAALDEPSVETGLTAYQVVRVRNSPGALGTVINNLAALGVGRLLPLTVIGDDGEAYDLLRQLQALPVEPAGIVRHAGRQTPTYTKPLRRDAHGRWQELHRLDLRTRAPLPDDCLATLLARLDAAWQAADGLIVLDQVADDGQGVVSPAVRGRLEELAQCDPGKLIFVDSRRQIGQFRRAVLKPNRAECLRAAAEADETDDEPASAPAAASVGDLAAAAVWLARRAGQAVYCTQGEQGILLAQPDGQTRHIPAVPVDGPIDVVGAGDSTTAGIVTALLCGATPETAAAFGNLVASITIQQLGTTGTASPEQLLARAKP